LEQEIWRVALQGGWCLVGTITDEMEVPRQGDVRERYFVVRDARDLCGKASRPLPQPDIALSNGVVTRPPAQPGVQVHCASGLRCPDFRGRFFALAGPVVLYDDSIEVMPDRPDLIVVSTRNMWMADERDGKTVLSSDDFMKARLVESFTVETGTFEVIVNNIVNWGAKERASSCARLNCESAGQDCLWGAGCGRIFVNGPAADSCDGCAPRQHRELDDGTLDGGGRPVGDGGP
jgi:hypothetical protein